MKWISGGLVLMMACSGLMAAEKSAPESTESQLTVQDLDRQIKFLQDNIEKYNSMAKFFDRKAGSLQSHDFTGSRDSAALRDECRGIAQDLENHLGKLEAQREKMLEQKKGETK
jgi:hypothetical protein